METASASAACTSLVLLDPLERRVIMYLRLLRSGRRGRSEVEQDILARVGFGAEEALEHMERLERLTACAISRPLNIGSVDDVQATSDEQMVSKLVGAAAGSTTADLSLFPNRDPAALAAREDLTRAPELAACVIAAGTAARCSCGRTSSNDGSSKDLVATASTSLVRLEIASRSASATGERDAGLRPATRP
jgi:hypothetical protein